jgi:putative addiction module CopG family antidote
MTIVPADVQPIIHQAITDGRGTDEVDVVRQALRLYAELEQRRQSLKREIDQGLESGASIPGELVFEELERLADQLAANTGTTA